LLTICMISPGVSAEPVPEFTIEIRDHLFFPSTSIIPADTKVKFIIVNKDSTPEEFESHELNREKVIMGNSKAIIFVGPLTPGDYPFFGEFNPKTAQGLIRAQN
jgi:hypothetical protein